MNHINNTAELVDFFASITAPTRVLITTRTPVKMNKKDVATKSIANPFDGDLFKVQDITVEINTNYEAEVNERRFEEGRSTDFTAEGRAWGKHVNGAIVENNGTHYLHCIEVEKHNSNYERGNGTLVQWEEFSMFVPTYKGNANQGIDNEVKVRTFKLTNVIQMDIDNSMHCICRDGNFTGMYQ